MKSPNTFSKFIHIVTAGLLLAGPGSMIFADDTDIYINNMPTPESAPLVMFSLDYRSNLESTICSNVNSGCPQADYFRSNPMVEPHVPTSGKLTFFKQMQLALRMVFEDIEGVNVGLMLNHNHQNNCVGPSANKCSNGGYIAMGFEQFVSGDTNGAKEKFMSILDGMPPASGSSSHSYQGAELFFEFFRYITGQGIYNAHNGWTDYGSNNSNNLDVDFPNIAWDTSIEHPSEKRYLSPLANANQCAKIFTINFMFQVSNQDNDSKSAMESSVANGGMGITIPPGAGAGFTAAIRYLRDADLADGSYGAVPSMAGTQNVTSYFIIDPRFVNNTTNGYAQAGGTNAAIPFSEDPEVLVDTITGIFKEILSVSTTFVAASVPVNVFNRAESLDNVFIALFQAEEEPFWPGNLKKLKLAVVESEIDQSQRVELQDKNGKSAIALDGRIRYDALTYWTDPNSLPDPDPDTEEVALRDGRVVDRGAAGQMIPGFVNNSLGLSNGTAGEEPAPDGPRKVLYDVAVGQDLAALNVNDATANAVKDKFGAGTSTNDSKDLIKWLRGIDPATGSKRDWILGDPLHSRPLPINYGLRDGHSDMNNPLIYIAMASNDGYMHFFRNTDGSGNEIGKEVWAFVPTEIMDKIPTLKKNVPTDPKHPYTVDGAPSVYLKDADGDGTISGEKSAFLYFGLRRGGKAYYGIDISSPNAPKLAWKITKTSGGDFDELGYTWSRPQVGYMNYSGNGAEPVVVFAGGYDNNKDSRGGAVGTDDSEGNAIYVVHAESGDLIWKVKRGSSTGSLSSKVYTHSKMVDSIPSDVTIVDSNGDGTIDRILVGDTGGRVWRIDTYGVRENWQATLLASVGRHANTGTINDRRFFHKPDVVQTQEEVETEDGTDLIKYDAVILGSGNRPNPLDREYASAPMNWMYMIKDNRLLPAKASPAPEYAVTDLDYQHDDFGDITDPLAGSPSSEGWKLKLEAGPGEKSLSSPLTLSNTVYFTTYLPRGRHGDETTVETETDDGILIEEATCGPSEGSGLLYAVNLQTGRAANNYNTSDDSEFGDNSASDRYKELASAGIPADVVGINLDGKAYVLPPDLTPEVAPASSRWRTFWYEVENNKL